MLTIENVKEKLAKVMYPGFAKSIVDFGFVKDIAVDGDKVAVYVEITSSAEEVEKELREGITKELTMLGATDLNIAISKP
ncbi:MAG: iron-sulfur cluster assembly protein, partial [Epsilonproteobacteria bacterium]|nr:iron-sulfur cluster assembly protein [Campylobacterota bacterium]